MSIRRWVTVKEIYEVGPGAEPIHPGTYGLIHNVDEKGIYVCFPQCHNYFPLDKLKPIETMPKMKQALKDIRHFIGHHCTSDGQFQFKVKAYKWKFPDIIDQHMEDERKYDIAGDIAAHELRSMVDDDEGLIQLFDFIGTWHQAGRSGGWLVFTCDLERDPDHMLSDFDRIEREGPTDDENGDETDEGMELVDRIIDTAMALRYIECVVKRGVAAYESWVSSDEAWEEEIQAIKEQLKDENMECSDGEDGDYEQFTAAG